MVVTGFAEATFADIVAHQSACQSLTLKLPLDNAYLLQGKNCQGYDNLQFNFRCAKWSYGAVINHICYLANSDL